MTKTGAVVGSPVYMNPEQCQGSELDAKSDLYSIACVMYESLNGAPPFQADSSFEVMYKHISENRISTKELSAHMEIPENLAKEILRGLNKDKAQRPESAKKYAESLGRALDEITLDRSPRRITKSNTRTRSSTWTFRIAAAILSSIVVGSVFAVLSLRHENPVIASKTSAESYLEKADKLSETAGNEEAALNLCKTAISLASKGSRTTLAKSYKSACRIIFQIKDEEKRKGLLRECSSYALKASNLFGTLQMQNDYLSANESYLKAEIDQGKFEEAQNFLSRVKNEGGHNTIWITRKKLEILRASNQLAEVSKLAQQFLTQNKNLDHTYDYFMVWTNYSTALQQEGKVKEALKQEELLAQDLVKSRTVLLVEKSTIADGLELFMKKKPADFLHLFKDDL